MLRRLAFGIVAVGIGLAGLCRIEGAEPRAKNILRNGSFEGGLLYWHGIEPDKQRLVRGDAAVGEFALRVESGFVMSAPFVARRGEPVTVSFFVKGDKPGVIDVSMPPSAREVGVKAGRLWTRGAGKTAKFDTQWRRVSMTWIADVPPDGFWPNPHYMVQLGGGESAPFLVDGVTVVLGSQGTPAYVPRRPIEVLADCPDLPGYAGGKANLFERGAAPRVAAHVSNPGPRQRQATVRWQLIDYEGERPLGEAVEKSLVLPAGKTASLAVPMKLGNGLSLARVTVLEDGAEIDRSDLPLATLPYPKAATQPDWREKFGGSFAGGSGCVEKFQRLGFGWIRWRPHSNGEDHLPVEPKPGEAWKWHWFDRELDEQEAHGCSAHCVLYPPPKWIMEQGRPLPKDMRWPADDPRWDDLSVQTVWDKFVLAAVAHYRGRSLVYEIENEPEFDHWDDFKEQYARFTIRTARQIKRADPKARVMVDNVYGIPSGLNRVLFERGGLKHIDIVSWHDYHAGWLADALAIRRMRQNLDEAGGKHVEIWFNEGWAFTNTAVDEPIACTDLTSAQSTHAIFDSVAELTVNGQDKTILFHTASEEHGMSFWDYSGPGTMLWDWYNYPLPLAPAWNVVAHHIGVSEPVAFVRPPSANFCVFQDLRNGRGVMIAYADRESKADAVVELPDFGAPLVAEDLMGNAAPAASRLTLSKTGRPVILYAADGKIAGKQFAEKLLPLDRKHASFVTGGTQCPSWQLPPSWEGKAKGQSEGSIASAGGKPVWKLEQVWPPQWNNPKNFRPMVWTGTDWNVGEGGFGGQPGARLDGTALTFGTRAPHGTPPQRRVAGLTFVAPQDGTYRLGGTVECRIWDGTNSTTLRLLHKSAGEVREAGKLVIPNGQSRSLGTLSVGLKAGDELCLLPEIEGMFAGGDCKLRDIRITARAAEGPSKGGPVYRLPATWEGTTKGSPQGNPIAAGGKPLWRIDRIYPDQYNLVENYSPAPWDGTAWHPSDRQQGGQPSVQVENGTARLSVSGPWQDFEHQKIAALVFITPADGTYRVRCTATSKPWTGGSAAFLLLALKKDTQRAAEVERFSLPRDGKEVAIDFRVELTAGHELVLLPVMPDWNNATTTTLEQLTIQAE